MNAKTKLMGFILWLHIISGYAQLEISTLVVDKTTRQSLSSVQIYIGNDTLGISTDKIGAFHTNIPSKTKILLIKKGYSHYATISDSIYNNAKIYLIPSGRHTTDFIKLISANGNDNTSKISNIYVNGKHITHEEWDDINVHFIKNIASHHLKTGEINIFIEY
jgi:hypothetical protein